MDTYFEPLVLAAAAGTGTQTLTECRERGGQVWRSCGEEVATREPYSNQMVFTLCSSFVPLTPPTTGWAAANRLLSSPELDVGLLLGMVLGATLVILILKARGQDVNLLAPLGPGPGGAAEQVQTMGRSGSARSGGHRGGAGHGHPHGHYHPSIRRTSPNSSSSSSPASSSPSLVAVPSTMVEAAGHAAGQAVSALRRIASQTGLAGVGVGAIGGGAGAGAGGGGGSSSTSGETGLDGNGTHQQQQQQPWSGRSGGRSRETSARFAQTLRDPRYNGVKLIDWTGTQVPFNEVVDFENEYFKGHVLFMLRTKPEDPRYVAHFAGKQRLFEMQIQGKFKKLPQGVLYMGAELTERMHMGLVTKTVAGMILGFARRVLKNLHYSFGDKPGGVQEADEMELPHLTFPLSRGMDRLVITPVGGKIPPLGKEFFEPDEVRIPRRGKGEEPQFVLGPTYSMSFHSMYMDFAQWQLVNIAGQKSIDLAGYFGDSSVHIVVYDLDARAAGGGGDRHRKCDKRYFYLCELMQGKGEEGGGGGGDLVGVTETGGSSRGVGGVGGGVERSSSRRLSSPRVGKEKSLSNVSVSGGGEGRGEEGGGGAGGAGGGGGGGGDAITAGTSGGEGVEEGQNRNEGGVVKDEGGEGGEEAMLGAEMYVRSGDIVPLLAATSSSLDDPSTAGAAAAGGGEWVRRREDGRV